MKKELIIFTAFAIAATSNFANAASQVGQCVYPKSKPGKGGRLEFIKPIYISSTPTSNEKQVLTTFESFTVKAESNDLIQLVTVPDYGLADPDKAAGKVVGWAKLADFKIVPIRNCN